MYDSVVLLLFPLILSTARSNSVCPATREFKLTFSSVDVPSVSFLWSRSGGGSREACAGDCVRDSKCVSFFYNTNTDICTSHDVHFSSTDLDDGDSMYFTMTIDRRDCADILSHYPTSQDGLYTVNPLDGEDLVRVYCDMTTDGGGWTVFQRRQDNTVDFYRNWADYKEGFGDLEGEFWLGNDIISRLTERPSQLRIDMKDQYDETGFAKYSSFQIGEEASSYQLSVSGFTGDRGDSLEYHDGMSFSTKDKDQDQSVNSCAQILQGGWWYKSCYASNLNGPHGILGTNIANTWATWHWEDSLNKTEMKFKPA